MIKLLEGAQAPDFALSDKEGTTHQLSSGAAKYTVLYFYPKDDTPGCTIEAQEFNAALPEFHARNVRVIGISGGTEKTKGKFCSKYKLSLLLLSDTDFSVANSYNAYGDKKFMGRSYQGIFRKTFLIDKQGMIVRIFNEVKPAGHALQLLASIDALEESGR